MIAVFLLVVAFMGAAHAQSDPSSMVSYEEKYLQGIKAYSQSKWKDCIVHMRWELFHCMQREDIF